MDSIARRSTEAGFSHQPYSVGLASVSGCLRLMLTSVLRSLPDAGFSGNPSDLATESDRRRRACLDVIDCRPLILLVSFPSSTSQFHQRPVSSPPPPPPTARFPAPASRFPPPASRLLLPTSHFPLPTPASPPLIIPVSFPSRPPPISLPASHLSPPLPRFPPPASQPEGSEEPTQRDTLR